MTKEEAQNRNLKRVEGIMGRVERLHIPKSALEILKVYIANVPKMFRYQYLKAIDPEKASPANAIRLKCYDCCGYENIAEEVGDCRSYSCPLWPHRPKQKRKIPEDFLDIV